MVAAEAKMLRETNAELLSFMSELESASMDTAREGEAMAAQVEALKRELAAAKDALERFANAPRTPRDSLTQCTRDSINVSDLLIVRLCHRFQWLSGRGGNTHVSLMAIFK